MEVLLSLFTDYTFQIVALGTGMLGLLSGVVGSFAVSRRQSLLGDALSHAALPGIVLGFLVMGYKNWGILMLGATISGLLATILILWLSQKAVKLDSALALVLSSFFGLGLVLLTFTQRYPNAQQAGLENFIYGQASAMLQRDVILTLIAGGIILTLVGIFWKELKVFTFDPDFTKTLGFNTIFLEFLLSSMLVVVIILGLESVGVILMSALIVAPPVAARQWTNRFGTLVLLSGLFGSLSGIIGTVISSLEASMPTGPVIVVVASVLVLISVLFAPSRGLIAKAVANQRRKKKYRKLSEAAKSEGGVKS